MKTFLIFLSSLAALLAGAFLFHGRWPEVGAVFAGVFTSLLTAWTSHQYDRRFLPLIREEAPRLPQINIRQDPSPRWRQRAA